MTDFKRVFVDTAPIIYYLENNAQYKDVVKRFFIDCVENHRQIVTSALTIEEYLVFPYSSGRMKLFADIFRHESTCIKFYNEI